MGKIIIVLMFISSVIFAQEDNELNKNAVNITVGGIGLGLSANYSRVVVDKENYFVDASVGIGVLPAIGGVSIPHSVSYNLGKETNFLEIGLGGNYWTGKTNSSGYTESTYSYQLAPIIGWRRNFKNNLIFRAYASPLIHISGEYFYDNQAVIPYLGLSLGYGF